MRAARDGWKARARDIADFQSRFLLTAFYFTVLAPFGLLTRLLSDPLRLHRRTPGTAWCPRPPTEGTIEGARRQF